MGALVLVSSRKRNTVSLLKANSNTGSSDKANIEDMMQPSTENPHAESSLIHFNSYTVGSLSRNTITMVGAAIAQPVRSNPPRVRTLLAANTASVPHMNERINDR